MGYRIEYDGEVVRWKQERMRLSRIVCYTLICFLIFGLLTYFAWPTGWQVFEQWIYPGDTMVTKTALTHMATNLRNGEQLTDAVVTFCREILDGAQIPG